jgi:hypothetical protein
MVKKAKRRTVRAWSSEDVRSLRSLAKARMSGPQIAKKLKRAGGGGSEGVCVGRKVSIRGEKDPIRGRRTSARYSPSGVVRSRSRSLGATRRRQDACARGFHYRPECFVTVGLSLRKR